MIHNRLSSPALSARRIAIVLMLAEALIWSMAAGGLTLDTLVAVEADASIIGAPLSAAIGEEGVSPAPAARSWQRRWATALGVLAATD